MGSLPNIGLSCYMNAVLYALRYTPTFLANFHHLYANILLLKQKIAVYESDCTKCEASRQTESNSLSDNVTVTNHQGAIDVFEQLHSLFYNLNSGVRRHVRRDLIVLQKSIHAINKTFEPKTQQDSHEFLMFNLNCVRDASNALSNMVSPHPDSIVG